jgi:uncharacterized protein YacL (UPF0231 family)
LKKHAFVVVEVIEVKWNGEEWWVESRGVDSRESYWNTLGRWIEATVFVTEDEVPAMRSYLAVVEGPTDEQVEAGVAYYEREFPCSCCSED